MKFIISGGGTAGHINPAIAIADKLRENDPEAQIIFVGSRGGMENNLVPLASYPIIALDTAGFKRKLSLSNIKTFFKNRRAEVQAKKVLLDISPDAVIGTGGYVCYPVIKAASKLGIYTALHESNAVPGLAVRALKKRVDRIFVSFEACAEALGQKEKCVFSGNPVKTQISSITREDARKKLGVSGKYRYVIVSFGGSLGAETVNRIALEIMYNRSAVRGDIFHIHSCGKNGAGGFFDSFNERELAGCKNIRASEYIYDMPLCLMAADIVICRSGAMTLAEIAQAGIPSILVPSPNVTADHQYKNAVQLANAGAAFMVDERAEDAPKKALAYADALLQDTKLRHEMGQKAKQFSRPNAGDEIAKGILNDIKRG